ncbi:MAG: metal ABC transporter permease [Gemmataceae bacterium]
MAPLDLLLTAMVTAAACAVPGVFLVLRRQAMAGDAIGHVILPGIVIGFFIAGTLQSPIVVIGAALMGVAAIAAVEWLERSGLIRGDAALGLIYPALFSVGVVLVSKKAGNVHLDTDAVLMGELAIATLRRFEMFGRDFGPWSLVVMANVLLVNLLFVGAFYKELKITTFDPAHAQAIGIPPGRVHYALMTLVALTVVAAFDAAGAVLVVAFLVAPAATAYLLTNRLERLIALAVAIGVIGAGLGTELSVRVDANVAGAIAAMLGGLFAAAFVFAPRHGLAAQASRRVRLAREFERGLLVVHLVHHEKTHAVGDENRADRLTHHLKWPAARVNRVLDASLRLGLVRRDGPLVALTDRGRAQARELLSVPI